ncbi:hypothetical protein [Streptomyces sp. NPDC018352]|uniref:hypothetical protein n=1 Tax=Streptomyces sp. NPDC018352 TaxID=3157194 RepID=UPI003406E335
MSRRTRSSPANYVVGQWEGGGTHAGPITFDDLPIGSASAAPGKTLRFTGKTVLEVQNGLFVEELGLDDGVKVLQQLGIIPAGRCPPGSAWH